MSSKFNPEALNAGMTVGVNFVAQLQKEIVAEGGSPILIWWLTTPNGSLLMNFLAKQLVKMQIPVPRSEIEERTARYSHDEEGNDDRLILESDRRFFWSLINLEKTYGIDVLHFSNQEGSKHPLVPLEVAEQIAAKPLMPPLVVTHEGELYVVVKLYSDTLVPGDQPQIGDEWPANAVTCVGLAKVKEFDLDS